MWYKPMKFSKKKGGQIGAHMNFKSIEDAELYKTAQDIKIDYISRFPEAFKRDENEYIKFHMFFLPRPVPRGLDSRAIRTCICLYMITMKLMKEVDRCMMMEKLPDIKLVMTKKEIDKFLALFLEELAKK